MSRPSKDKYLMGIALEVAKRSTCTSHFAVGAVASRDGFIISTGYNGAPAGMPHCDDRGCVKLADGKHAYLLHAEENVVLTASRLGISLAGATIHVTHFPCSHCSAVLIQAGIVRVVFAGVSMEGMEHLIAWTMLEQCGVEVYQLGWMDGALHGLDNVLKEAQHENSEQTKRTAGLGNTGPEAGDSDSSEDDVLRQTSE